MLISKARFNNDFVYANQREKQEGKRTFTKLKD